MGLSYFKACDIRAKLGAGLDDDIACRTGSVCGEFLKPKSFVVGEAVSKNLVIGRTDGVSLEFFGSLLNCAPPTPKRCCT